MAGKKRARAVLLTAPTREMNKLRCGIASARITVNTDINKLRSGIHSARKTAGTDMNRLRYGIISAGIIGLPFCKERVHKLGS